MKHYKKFFLKLCLLSILLFLFPLPAKAETVSRDDFFTVPEYTGEAVVEINGGEPFFTGKEAAFLPEQYYGELDSLGRCTGAYAYLSKDLMPKSSRNSITEIWPSGWQKDELGSGGGIYQRCHLIANQLTGQDHERNLITGTQYLNTESMRTYEESVAQYVQGTGNHVMYRVTPVFEGENLVASGVLMEARSVEDDRICFCVYCFNIQPDAEIDYLTGAVIAETGLLQLIPDSAVSTGQEDAIRVLPDYVVNKNTKKFHYPYCSSADSIKPKNRWDYQGTREELISMGYSPCRNCNP